MFWKRLKKANLVQVNSFAYNANQRIVREYYEQI